MENRMHPSGLEEKEVGNFCCRGIDFLLCPGKTQGTVAEPPRWKPWPKIHATEPLGFIWVSPVNTCMV